MIAKTLIATSAIAAAMGLAIPAADAKTHVDLNIGIGVVPGYYDGGYVYDGYGAYDPGYRHRHYDSYEDDYGITCGQGRRIVDRAGFYKVRPLDCDGPNFRYSARRDGLRYIVSVDEDGDIVRVRRAY